MTKVAAQRLGAVCALLFVVGFFIWERARGDGCPGGLFIELHPPLAEPGPYQFELGLGDKTCQFEVPLPLAHDIDTSHCKMALDLKTRTQGKHTSITGLAVAAHPQRLALKIQRSRELVYATTLTPKYTPYPARKEDSKRFCGEQAFLEPACVRGSSACTPFKAACDGPEDCPGAKVCCASPEAGREYGAEAASACSSLRRCIDQLSRIACHADSDCPKDMACDDSSLADAFVPALRACHARAR